MSGVRRPFLKLVPKPKTFSKWSTDYSLDFQSEITVGGGIHLQVRIVVDRRLFYLDIIQTYDVTVHLPDGHSRRWENLTNEFQSEVEQAIEREDDSNGEDAWMREQEYLLR